LVIFLGNLYLSPVYGQFGIPSQALNEVKDFKVGAGYGVANKMYQAEAAYSPLQYVGIALTGHYQYTNRNDIQSEYNLDRFVLEGRIGGYYLFDRGSEASESKKQGVLLEGYVGYGQGKRKLVSGSIEESGVFLRKRYYSIDLQKYFVQGSVSLLRNVFQGTFSLKYGSVNYPYIFLEGSWNSSFYEKLRILEADPQRTFFEGMLKLQFWGKGFGFYTTISFIGENDRKIIDEFYRNIHIGMVVDLNDFRIKNK